MLLFLWRERLYPSPMPPPLQPTLSAEVVPRFSLASHKVRSKLVRPTVPHDTHHTLGSLPPEKRCFWGAGACLRAALIAHVISRDACAEIPLSGKCGRPCLIRVIIKDGTA